MHETPRRILILKTEGSRFAFSDYVFPGEAPEEALYIAREILNLPEEKMELYDLLEKGIYFKYIYKTLKTKKLINNFYVIKGDIHIIIHYQMLIIHHHKLQALLHKIIT